MVYGQDYGYGIEVYGEVVMYIPLFSRFPLVRKDVYVPYVFIAANFDLFSAFSTAASPHCIEWGKCSLE